MLGIMGWHIRTDVLHCQEYGALRNVPYFWGNKKRIGNAGACWENERSLFGKTKTKQMQRCNPPRFKTNRWTKGNGIRQHRYFEGFTTAAICQNQSERSLFHGTKNEWSVIATLQTTECGPWHTQEVHIDAFRVLPIVFMLNVERGQYGAIRGHGGGGICRLLFSFGAF